MLKLTNLIGFGNSASSPYYANAVDYNGSTDYLERSTAFSGAPTTGQGIFNAWFRIDGGAGTLRYLWDISSGTEICRALFLSDNTFQFIIGRLDASVRYTWTTTTAFGVSSSWRNILIYFNHNALPASRTFQVYVDGVSDGAIAENSGGAFTMDYSTFNSCTVAFPKAGLNYYNGCTAELYFGPSQSLDFSSSSNRNLFRNESTGKPVSLGSNGSLPTGSSPLLYLPNPAATTGTNAGTGGNMTIFGAPTAASTSPSD